MSTLPTNAQFGIAVKLIVSNQVQGLDLSDFRITFNVSADDTGMTNIAVIRVHNLKWETMQKIVAEYNSVVLQAGYQNDAQQIFVGSITRFERGKESNTETFLEIFAADGDEGYNFGVISQSFAAGSHRIDWVNAIAASMGASVDKDLASNLTGGILPRGRVLYGMSRVCMFDLSKTSNARWSIQNGVLTLIQLTGYLPGDAVVVNSQTGMIGIPKATEDGIKVRTLLNPKFKIGCRIQINELDISAYPNLNNPNLPGYLPGISADTLNTTKVPPYLVAATSSDGFYRIMAIDHLGDTRGNMFFSDLTCLLVDPTAPISASVQAY